MKNFYPTHQIGRTLYMEIDRGLYTFSEWMQASACDYSFSDEGDLLFHGQPASGPLYFVTKVVTGAYDEMMEIFDGLLRYDWSNISVVDKVEVFTEFGKDVSEGLFDPQPFIDHYSNL